MGRWICALIVFVHFPTASHAVELLKEPMLFCVPEVSGGVRLENGKWVPGAFNTDKTKYLVEPLPAELAGTFDYQVKQMGSDYPDHRCNWSGSDKTRLICGGLGYGMVIDVIKLRYIEIYSLGYIDNDLSGGNTPAVSGGLCTKLSQ